MYLFFQKLTHTKNNSEKNARGFTLVEMLVSLALFSVVITVGIGSLLIMVDVNAKAQALYSTTSSLSFAIDTMTREIRTGYHYYCYVGNDGGNQEGSTGYNKVKNDPYDTKNCPNNPGKKISFTRERDGAQYGYRLLKDANDKGVLQQYVDNDNNNGEWIDVTSLRNVDIESFDIIVRGSETNNTVQPSVDIFIQGEIYNGLDVPTKFNIQTHVVQRKLDLSF